MQIHSAPSAWKAEFPANSLYFVRFLKGPIKINTKYAIKLCYTIVDLRIPLKALFFLSIYDCSVRNFSDCLGCKAPQTMFVRIRKTSRDLESKYK